MSDQTKKGTGKKTGWVVLVSVVAVLILAAAGLMVYAANYQGIFPNTYIGECRVGGMTREEAIACLEETYRPEAVAGKELLLSCEDGAVVLAFDD